MLERISSPSRSRKLDRGDRALMWLLTAVYTIFTLVNLGTLRFPQNQWRGEPSASVTIDLGEEKEVAAFRYNGGIGLGEMTITADDGSVFDFSQVYGDMFSWRVSRLGFTTRYLLLECVSGEVVFNEIAFADPEGTVLKASVVGEEGTALLDEQDTLPKKPSYFNGMYFDEIYHARTAYEFLHTMSVYEWTHPPLGKELIALGVAVFGMKPFGWRVVPALFGAAMLPVLFILGKRLFRRRDCAFLASALFALDTMHFAQTRIATVDVFVVFFILLMYLFMTDYLYLDAEKAPVRKAFLPLGACGIAFGLGTASKWTGLYAGAGLAVLFFANLFGDIVRSGKGEESRRAWGRAWKTIAFCCVFFLLVPAAIYFLSYIPFYRYEAAADPGTPMTFRRMLDILVRQQESMYSYHSALTATHSSQSAWYEWPFGAMSVWFYCSSNESGGLLGLRRGDALCRYRAPFRENEEGSGLSENGSDDPSRRYSGQLSAMDFGDEMYVPVPLLSDDALRDPVRRSAAAASGRERRGIGAGEMDLAGVFGGIFSSAAPGLLGYHGAEGFCPFYRTLPSRRESVPRRYIAPN